MRTGKLSVLVQTPCLRDQSVSGSLAFGYPALLDTHVTSFDLADSLREVAEALVRDSFCVIPYRDVMTLKHNFV